jgi:CBS domain-containing protein
LIKINDVRYVLFQHINTGFKRRKNPMKTAKVKELMSPYPMVISSDASLQQAAQLMQTIDCGILPVGGLEDVEGVITDRDIVIRAVSQGKDPVKEKVRDYMTSQVYGCNEDDYLEDAAQKMRLYKVSRLIVRNRSGKVVGILSFGGILRREADAAEIAGVVKHASGISRQDGSFSEGFHPITNAGFGKDE